MKNLTDAEILRIKRLTASEILKITVPEKLFTGDFGKAKSEHRLLASRWHPDRGGDNKVLAHVQWLYEAAEKKLASGRWIIPGLLEFTTKDRKKYQVKYRKHHPFELGDMYISDTVVAYVIRKENADLVRASKKIISGFQYSSDRMRKECERYLPKVKLDAETDDSYVVVYEKTPDLILLKDVIDHWGGELPTQHAAWILSSAYNLACYLSFNSISHNAISASTYFISPKYHSGALLGGWWYSSKFNQKLIALPKATIDECKSLIVDKTSTGPSIDLQLIKTMGLEMLGDPHGTKMLMKMKTDAKAFPAPFINWLKTTGGKRAVTDYKIYKDKVLIDSWGEPKYFEMELSANDVYEM